MQLNYSGPGRGMSAGAQLMQGLERRRPMPVNRAQPVHSQLLRREYPEQVPIAGGESTRVHSPRLAQMLETVSTGPLMQHVAASAAGLTVSDDGSGTAVAKMQLNGDKNEQVRMVIVLAAFGAMNAPAWARARNRDTGWEYGADLVYLGSTDVEFRGRLDRRHRG